jgi:hypothetical protein
MENQTANIHSLNEKNNALKANTKRKEIIKKNLLCNNTKNKISKGSQVCLST